MTTLPFAGVRAVLFDLDGTLIDSAPDLGAAVDGMRVRRGLPGLALDCYRSHAGSGARGMLQVAFGVSPDHGDYPALKEEFFEAYDGCLTQRTQAFAGVDELLGALVARGLPWGVVTNKSQRFAIPITRSMEVFSSAAVMICGDTTPHTKPHPEPLFEAARRLGVAPQHCIYIGDDERDILAGKAAGMATVAARYGYLGHGADVSTWRADAEISSPTELLKLLELA